MYVLTLGALMLRGSGLAQWQRAPYPSYREQNTFLRWFSGVVGQSHSTARHKEGGREGGTLENSAASVDTVLCSVRLTGVREGEGDS